MQTESNFSYPKGVFDVVAQVILEKPGLNSIQIAKKTRLSVSYMRSILPHVCNFYGITRKKKGNTFFYFPAKPEKETQGQLVMFPSPQENPVKEDFSISKEAIHAIKEIGGKEALQTLKEIALRGGF
jgi:hypothetical protein